MVRRAEKGDGTPPHGRPAAAWTSMARLLPVMAAVMALPAAFAQQPGEGRRPPVPPAGTDQIMTRYRELLGTRNPPSLESVKKYVQGLSRDGTWPDIKYADPAMSSWQPLAHLQRVREMAHYLAAGKKSSPDERAIREAINLALDHWCAKRYRAPNWFFNEISVPGQMRDILVLLGDDLSGERRKGVLEVVGQHRMRATGANLMMSAELSLHHGCLTGNAPQAEKAAQTIWNEISTSRPEGIQWDGSFYQHGPRLQTFHYGSGYLDVVCKIAWQLRQTPWAIPPAKRDLVSDYILAGPQWMCRGVFTAPGTIDRAASRKGSLGSAGGLAAHLRLWREVDVARRREFDDIIARLSGKEPPLTGYRHFPMGDFTVYHRPAASVFVKTISDRTRPSESINSENLKGVPFLGCGDHYVMRDGLEYHNLQPVWQWNRLPGLTLGPEEGRQTPTSFVGGVGNGASGLTAMEYARAGANGTALALRKAWFFHGDVVICLMSGAGAGPGQGPVVSSIEQCRLRGDVSIRSPMARPEQLKPGEYAFSGANRNFPRWIIHNDIGYLPAGMEGLTLTICCREGNWRSVNQQYDANPVREDVFEILAEHGAGPGPCGWAIVLGATPRTLDALAANPPWRVLPNDPGGQTILFRDGLRMTAFFAPGSAGPTRELAVDKPCLAMWTQDRLWLSDPTMKGREISVVWQQRTRSLTLPPGGRVLQIALADMSLAR